MPLIRRERLVGDEDHGEPLAASLSLPPLHAEAEAVDPSLRCVICRLDSENRTLSPASTSATCSLADKAVSASSGEVMPPGVSRAGGGLQTEGCHDCQGPLSSAPALRNAPTSDTIFLYSIRARTPVQDDLAAGVVETSFDVSVQHPPVPACGVEMDLGDRGSRRPSHGLAVLAGTVDARPASTWAA